MNSIKNLFEKAKLQHRCGNLDAAFKIYQSLLKSHPNHIPSLQAIAILLAQVNQTAEALHYIEQALKLQPEMAELHSCKANILLKMGDYFSAEAAFKTAIHYDPSNAYAYNNLGNAFYHQRLFVEAIVTYQTAIKLNPDLVDAKYNLASIYSSQAKNEEAIHLLKEVVHTQPHHLKALTQLAKIFYNQASYADSIHYFQMAISLNPQKAELQHDLGLALLAHKAYLESIEHFETCLKLNETHLEAHYHLATAYLNTNELEKALNHYMQQLAIQPNLDSYYNIGVLLTAQQRNPEAIPYFKKVLELDPNYQNAHLNLGVIHLKANRPKEAIYHYEQALKINPDDAEISYILSGLKQNKEIPLAAPTQYVSHLFDQYALYYDKHLKEYLRYQVPEAILKNLKYSTDIENSQWKVLDLGCGTGLMGELLKAFSTNLVGVDISANMLDLAEQKNIYTQLEEADITSHLKNAENFNLIVAADVFSYHGNLAILFEYAHAALVEGGYFIFTVERGFNYPYHLQASLRYTHTKEYMEELIQIYNFNIINFENLVLRYQQKEAVEGYLVLLQKQ